MHEEIRHNSRTNSMFMDFSIKQNHDTERNGKHHVNDHGTSPKEPIERKTRSKTLVYDDVNTREP